MRGVMRKDSSRRRILEGWAVGGGTALIVGIGGLIYAKRDTLGKWLLERLADLWGLIWAPIALPAVVVLAIVGALGWALYRIHRTPTVYYMPPEEPDEQPMILVEADSDPLADAKLAVLKLLATRDNPFLPLDILADQLKISNLRLTAAVEALMGEGLMTTADNGVDGLTHGLAAAGRAYVIKKGLDQ